MQLGLAVLFAIRGAFSSCRQGNWVGDLVIHVGVCSCSSIVHEVVCKSSCFLKPMDVNACDCH